MSFTSVHPCRTTEVKALAYITDPAKTENGKYVFETQSQNSTAKSPMGAFDTFEIENDIQMVLDAMEEF